MNATTCIGEAPSGPSGAYSKLADYVQVKDATFEDGPLRIALAREVPKALKPRQITIDVAGNDHHKSDRTQAA
jgi:molecular chaperone IbpA